MLHAIRTESPLKEIDNAAMLELASLHLKQIIGESEESETCVAQFAERCWNLRVRRHCRKFLRKLLLVIIIDFDAACIRLHFHDCRTDIGERYIAAGHGQRCRMQDEV